VRVPDNEPFMTAIAYIAAAMAEIAGCFAFWSYLRLGRSPLWLVPGIVLLASFAGLLTLSETTAAARAYAGYGGIYIVASLLWLWAAEHVVPDLWDLVGALLCCAGAIVIVAAPHR
jgi:small multidrug resistance family-3 protein